MNDFRDAYQSAIQDIKEFHIDVSSCMDERKHRYRVAKRAHKATATVFSAMCVLFVCGFGTVKAAEYFQNVIRVNECGFESGDAFTMSKVESKQNKCYVVEESLKTPMLVEDKEAPALMDEVSEEALKEKQTAAGGQPMSVTDSFITDNSVTGNSVSGNGQVDAMPETEKQIAGDNEEDRAKEKELSVYSYSSWEEFEKSEDIIFPQPSISIGENITSTEFTVCGNWATVRYDVDDKVLWLERTDYADTNGHESSKVFSGGVCNERTYTTPEDYTYTLVDSVKTKDSDKLQIHAAVTVGSYEIYVDFLGFTEKEAKNIMDSINLSLYE
ncbi:MAG: hypothetical protein GX235_09195 [Clostridiales bacterium]|nr:hypothetical protein [Clostridiales bacterium]